jgi:tyrosyl-tRNA synthetase
MPKISFIEECDRRGFIYQSTNPDEVLNLTNNYSTAAYIGFDCTARSLHVGHLMQIMILRILQRAGHRPIILIGGGTTKIGDPSGKDEARQLLSDEEIEKNIAGIKKCLSKFLDFEGDNAAIMVNNADWLDEIGYIGFLRDFGKYVSVNRMLSMDSVKSRLDREQNLSFLEFNYMLLQAYDFMHLSRQYDCRLQIGGSDQWGNIVMGSEITKRVADKDVYGITTPLLTTSSGAKMGKTASGAIWLDEDYLSPYDYFQYWRNTEDMDVVKFATMFLDYSPEELEEFKALASKDINAAKKQLAHHCTWFCHGKEEADRALKTSEEVFEHGGTEGLPVINISNRDIEEGAPVYKLFVAAGLCSSNSEARKLIRGGGARLNDEKISGEYYNINHEDFANEAKAKLSYGKKNHVLVAIKD